MPKENKENDSQYEDNMEKSKDAASKKESTISELLSAHQVEEIIKQVIDSEQDNAEDAIMITE